MSSTSTTTVAQRLIADGRRPAVLGAVVLQSTQSLADVLFDVLAHLAEGADGIDLRFPTEMSPPECQAVADQLADTSGTTIHVRSLTPFASVRHPLVLPIGGARLRPGRTVVYDIGVDQLGASPGSAEVAHAWPPADDERPLLLSTTGFVGLDDGALIGLVTAASVRCFAAVSTDRVRIARRVVDVLAPIVRTGGVQTCR